MKQIVNRKEHKHRMKGGPKEGFHQISWRGERLSIRGGLPISVMRQSCQDLMMKENARKAKRGEPPEPGES